MLHAMASFDLVVVGAGIVGLAHALAGARRGLRVAVLEREACAALASVRNFGFVTITGQEGRTRERALLSRETWVQVAREAAIDVHQRGCVVAARRLEALAVLDDFARGEMGRGCELWDATTTRERVPGIDPRVLGALWSPNELRVEARDALPRIARWLEDRHGVVFAWNTAAFGVEKGRVHHAAGSLSFDAAVIAPGAAVAGFAPELAQRVGLRQCKLQMMRLTTPGFRLPAVVMGDLSLVRYEGFSSQPSAARLREVLERDCAPALADGVHVIVAQGSDGTLLVGDSHHYADSADPFASAAVDEVIVRELRALFELPALDVIERWVGHYPVADVRPLLSEPIAPRARLVSVTSGTGMSTAFAIGEETVGELFG